MDNNIKKYLNKINRGFGVEFVFIYIILLQIAGIFFAILIYYQKQAETNRISKDINSALCYEKGLSNRYPELGQYDKSEEEFNNTVKHFLEECSSLRKEYGSVFLAYLMKDERYKIGITKDYEENEYYTSKTLVNIKEIQLKNGTIVGAGVVLGDNNLYYLDTNSGEMLSDDTFDIRENMDAFYDKENGYNLPVANLKDDELIKNYSLDSGGTEFAYNYFIPEYDIKITEGINNEDFYDSTNNIKVLFSSIKSKKWNTGKRYVINREKSKEMVNYMVEIYNKKLGYEERAYSVNFTSVCPDLLVTPDSSKEKNSIDFYVQKKKSKDSFFFYGEEKNGYKENYGYRLRDYRDLEGSGADRDNNYYPMLANSMRLVLNTTLYIPLLNIKQPVAFGYDLILRKNERSE